MAKEIEPNEVNHDYDYLLDHAEMKADGIETQGLTFHKVSLGGTNDYVDEATGIEVSQKKYNSKAFPGFNYENLYVIPLVVLPKRRSLYATKYDGQSRPPDCFSNDGLNAAIPNTMVQGIECNVCFTCPFSVFGAQPGCKPRPAIFGVALFYVGGELKTVPVFLDVAPFSKSVVEDLMYAFDKPVVIGDKPKMLPRHTRVIKCGRTIKQGKSGPTTCWTMNLLGPNSNEKDQDEGLPIPNFTPPGLLEGIQDLEQAAKMFLTAQSQPVALLESATGSGPAPALTGAVEGVGSVDHNAPVNLEEDLY